MSSNQSDHEDLNPRESLDDFEAALAALRPRVGAPQSRTEFIPFVALHSTATSCDHPAGHRFVCLQCGVDAPQASRAHLWAWPSALAAMTSVAALLLVMLFVDRSERMANRIDKPALPKGAVVSTPSEPAAPPDRFESSGGRGVAFGRMALRTGDGRRILSAADIELRDDLLASYDGLNGNSAAAFTEIENSDARLSNGALMRRLLGNSDSANRPAE
jgi:hypothetical protein